MLNNNNFIPKQQINERNSFSASADNKQDCQTDCIKVG